MSHRPLASPLRTRRFCFVGSILVAAALLAPRVEAQEKVTFLTNWFAQAEHGGFYAGVTNGIYKKHGLDVTVRMGGPQVNVMQLLAAGQVGLRHGLRLLGDEGDRAGRAGDHGRGLVPEGSGVPRDSRGRERTSTSSRARPCSSRRRRARRGGRGCGPSTASIDDQVRPFTGNLQPFLADKNSATQGFITNSPFDIGKAGVKANYFLFADYGWPVYGSTIVTMHRSRSRTSPTWSARFVRASMEGWKQYLADPSAANAPDQAGESPGQPTISSRTRSPGSRSSRRSRAATPNDSGIGTMSEARYKEIYDLMVREGLLKPEVDYRQAFTTQFVKDLRVMP